MSLKTFVRSVIIQRSNYNKQLCALLINGQDKNRRRYYNNSRNQSGKLTGFILGSVIAGATLNDNKDDKDPTKSEETLEPGAKRPDLPTFRSSEITTHDNPKSFWVTYKHGVYDITNFLPGHPGGEQILNAGGLSVEPFWNVYGMHKTDQVFQILESYRIGNLHDDDIVDHSDDEMWAKEPYRDKRLIIKTAKPFNAEIPTKLQVESLDTPKELFYVRQHMPVPDMDAANHKLKVIIKNKKTKTVEFKLQDLSKFKTTTVRAALMCAGNRRSEMDKVKPVRGLSWAGGAISNGLWEGVPLIDVLKHCGVDPNDVEGKHVIFTGSDIDATGENFSTSIPLYMALDPNMKIILATKMNGEPLLPDHGYPLRVIVPGAPAVRSVKWLQSITISEDESSSHWHQKDYRAFNPSKTWDTADFSTAPPVYTLPVTSLICDPEDKETVTPKDGMVVVRGYAYSGGGAKILRVDITSDRGQNWAEAEFVAQDSAPPRQHFSWLLWQASIPVTRGQKELELWVKATDSNFNTQPETFNDIWNIRGILGNAYHKIKVNIKQQ